MGVPIRRVIALRQVHTSDKRCPDSPGAVAASAGIYMRTHPNTTSALPASEIAPKPVLGVIVGVALREPRR